ncbi:MAG: hypothetical protein C4330_09065 [Chitinophagaceae bacterium]
MPTTTKNNWLVIALIALVLINIATLAFVWLGKPKDGVPPKGQGGGNAKNYLIEQLKLTTQQQQQFDSLRTVHFNEMNDYREQMRQQKDALFEKLKLPTDSSYNSTAQQIGMLQSEIDLSTFHHFQSLRSILNDEQKKKFDNIIQDVLHNLGRLQGRPGMQEGRPEGPPNGGPPDDRPDGPPPGDEPPQH